MSNQIVISSGAKVRELEGVLTGTSGIVSSVPLGAANGVATLDSGGKVPVSQLPSSVVTYLGTWNAATNTPTLVNGTGDAGDMYICNVAGTVNFGAGPIPFAVGDWVLYGSGTWEKSNGQNGTVTSVAASITGSAIGLTGSPITTAGTLAFAFAGTNLQYVNGAGNLTTFPTLITSIGLSMPSAFSVANSPLTANGTIAVTGAGTTAQYIRGDGSLATFPTIATEAQRLITEVYNETGATLTKGTIVYINGGHGNLPTITKAIATGDATSAQTYGIVQTDITNMNNGYVVVIGSLTNLDTQAYANGTQLYLSSTTAGAWTSVKQYAPAHLVYVGIVTRSHPTQGVVEVRIQNGFEMDELHNVSAQSPLNNQGLFYNTSTSLWENKSIATALGYTPANDALVVHNTGNETIGGTKTFSDATKNNGGIFLQNASSNSLAGYMNLGGLTNGVKFTSGGGISNTFTLPSAIGYTFTFPNATGTIALTSDIPSITGLVPYTGATGSVNLGAYLLTASGVDSVGYTARGSGTLSGYLILKQGTTYLGNVVGYNSINANARKYVFISDVDGTNYKSAIFELSSLTNNTDRTYTLPDASGTIALVGGSGVGTVTSVAALTIGTSGTDLSSSVANSTTTPVITLNVPTASATNRGALSSADWTTFNNKQTALTNPVTGTGTTNYLPKFTGTSTIGNSTMQDDGTNVSITGGFTANSFLRVFKNGSDSLGSGPFMALYNAGATAAIFQQLNASNGLDWWTTFGKLMTLTSSGNLGLGVTPSAWNSSWKAFEIAGGYGVMAQAGNDYWSMSNAYYANDATFKYIASAAATGYSTASGQHRWHIAPSGTAGAAITFTQAMTLFATGNLTVGINSDNGRRLRVSTSSADFAAQISQLGSGAGSHGLTIDCNSSSSSLIGLEIYSSSASVYKTRLYTDGSAIFSSNVTAVGLVSSFTSNANSNNGINIVNSGTVGYGGAVTFNIGSGGINYNSARIYSENEGTGGTFRIQTANTSQVLSDRLLISNTGAATFSSSVTLSSSAGNLDVGGVAIIRGNGSAHNTHYLTTGAANVAKYIQYNASGTAINLIDAGGVSYINGGNVGIGGVTSPQAKLEVGGSIMSSGSDAAAQANKGVLDFNTGNTRLISFGPNTSTQGGFQFLTLASNGTGNTAMTITTGGNVLIGTTDDGGRLVSYSTNAATQIKAAGTAPAITFSNTVLSPTYGGVLGTCTSANQFLTGTSAGDMVLANQFSGYRVYVASYSGGVYLTSGATSWTANSDIRLKNINSHIENAVEKLSTLQTINFSYKDDKTNKQNLGLIAQEVEKIFPELIDKNGDGMLGVRYTELVPVLIKAVQELKLEIETLKNK